MTSKKYIENYSNKKRLLKNRLFIAIAVLLILTVLLIAVSFAWLSLSTAPEVVGIDTTVASNGGLEIALLNDSTFVDTGLIRSGVGSSLDVPDSEESNLHWGNLVDLSSEDYGLDKVQLVPTMLNINRGSSGAVSLGQSMLQLPAYGDDGRVTKLESSSVSGVYSEGAFTVTSNHQSYGVRAIGNADLLTSQQKVLLSSKSSISSYTESAKVRAKEALRTYGAALFGLQSKWNDGYTVTGEDIDALYGLSSAYLLCIDDIELAMRHGIITVLASQIDDEEQFEDYYEILANDDLPLVRALNSIPTSFSGMSAISGWVTDLDDAAQTARNAVATCRSLSPASATAGDIQPIINAFADAGSVFFGQTPFTESHELAYGDIVTVMPGGGIIARVADFIGEYSDFAAGWENEPANFDHEIVARTRESSAHLTMLSGIVASLNAANELVSSAEITDTVGYAVDLAFRVNADNASLLLQSAAQQRVYRDIDTWDGGSYLELLYSNVNIAQDKVVEIMDAIRVTFIDSNNNILGIAKLNTSNYLESAEGVSAPLHLYNFEAGSGTVLMGERRDDRSVITSLQKNVPLIVTAVVWLDGNAITNSNVNKSDYTFTAKLNLQFSTDVDLAPSEDGALRNVYNTQSQTGG